jgi:nucleotidyltransferase substrate binding protein (TIGR01987 family)
VKPSTLAARTGSFALALARLRAALDQPVSEWTRDASIQRFEFTFELAWKCAQQAAGEEGVPCPSPRAALRAALQLGWIDDDAEWLRMLDDRNLSSHAYDEESAGEVFLRLPAHVAAMDVLLERLRRRPARLDPES